MNKVAIARNLGVTAVINTASASAAVVGIGLAQLPLSDQPVLCGIQATMITSIALIHGHSITKSAALKLITVFVAGKVGRGISQVLIGWMPLAGNIVNASTAVAITASMGWYAHYHFSRLRRKF